MLWCPDFVQEVISINVQFTLIIMDTAFTLLGYD